MPFRWCFGILTARSSRGSVTTKIVYPIPHGSGKVEAVREFVLARPNGVAVAGFGNSYRTDGDFLRYIRSQPLPGGVEPLAVMINGGAEPKAFQGLFRRVDQQEVCGGSPLRGRR